VLETDHPRGGRIDPIKWGARVGQPARRTAEEKWLAVPRLERPVFRPRARHGSLAHQPPGNQAYDPGIDAFLYAVWPPIREQRDDPDEREVAGIVQTKGDRPGDRDRRRSVRRHESSSLQAVDLSDGARPPIRSEGCYARCRVGRGTHRRVDDDEPACEVGSPTGHKLSELDGRHAPI